MTHHVQISNIKIYLLNMSIVVVKLFVRNSSSIRIISRISQSIFKPIILAGCHSATERKIGSLLLGIYSEPGLVEEINNSCYTAMHKNWIEINVPV